LLAVSSVGTENSTRMGYILYLTLAVIGLLFMWVKRRFNYWTDRDRIYKQFKGKAKVAGIYFFLEPSILPIDPELFKNIFVRDFSSFHDRGFYYNKEDEPTSAK
jgi:cytochrome P450 family 6